ESVLPKGVQVVPCSDRTSLVIGWMNTAFKTTLQSGSLLLLVLLLLLGHPRAIVLITLVAPCSLLIGILGIGLLAIPCGLSSLPLLNLGFLVAAPVIFVENLLRHSGTVAWQTRHPYRLLLRATQEVQRPVVLVPLVIAAAYLMLLSLRHLEGVLFRPMAV